jgi:hypothetical protein
VLASGFPSGISLRYTRGPLRDTILHDHHDAACRELRKVFRRVPTREGLAATTWQTDPSLSSANEEMGSVIYEFCILFACNF